MVDEQHTGGRLLGVDELAMILHVRPGHVYTMVRRRQIPFHKLGKSLRFDLRKVLEATARNNDLYK